MPTRDRQRLRRWTQSGFFLLFLLAPALDLLRFDLNETQLWFLGLRWSLGIDAFLRGEIDATQAAISIVLRAFLPGLLLVASFLGVAWRWGRVFCGWLCPHFSLVETLNDLLHRACNKFSFWDRSATPMPGRQPRKRWWPLFFISCLLAGFTWAVTLLSYLLPPAEIWGNLVQGELTANQARFLGAGTLVFTLEFLFARHLFCRFGCVAGLFQSLVWMANPKGMVVSFERDRARECKTCVRLPDCKQADTLARSGEASLGAACDSVCPMRLHPRNIKRMMFSCVQCGQCLSACDRSQGSQQRAATLEWKIGLDAVRETMRQRREENS